jgi:asparagine synthase (glutamine-hydrolysing)
VTLAFPAGTPADERRFVDVLRARGLGVEDVAIDDLRILTNADQSVARTEMPRLVLDGRSALLRQARAAGCRRVLEGSFGDQLLAGQAYLVDMVRRGVFPRVKAHLEEMLSWLDDTGPEHFRERFRYHLVRGLTPSWLLPLGRRTIGRTQALRRYPGWYRRDFRERAIQRALDRGATSQRFPSCHAQQCWLNLIGGASRAAALQETNTAMSHGLDIAYPFADRDLVSFVASIPGEIVCDRGVPKAILRQAMRGVLPDPIRLRRSKGDLTFFNNRAVHAEQATMSRLFDNRSVAAACGFVDLDALRAHMPSAFRALAQDDDARVAWQLGETLGLEVWLRRFVTGDPTA